MARIVRQENPRVEVTIRAPYMFMSSHTQEDIEREYRTAGQQIVEQIKRHVDEVGDARFVFHSVAYCDKCGREWEGWPAAPELCAHCEEPEEA